MLIFYTISFDDGTIYQSWSWKKAKKEIFEKKEQNVNVLNIYTE